MSLRRIIAELDSLVTYPWDQQLRGQLLFWRSVAELAVTAEGEARDRLVAELKSQLRQWIGGIQENPWQWDYHGADVVTVLTAFEEALDTVDTDLERALELVETGYELVGVTG